MLETSQDIFVQHTFGHKEFILPKEPIITKLKSLVKEITSEEKPSNVLEPEILEPHEEIEESLEILENSLETSLQSSLEIVNDENDDENDNENDNFDSLLFDSSRVDFELLEDDYLNSFDKETSNLPQVSSTRLPDVLSRDNLQLYLREISIFPMLKPEEELELTKRVQENGDSDAAFKLVSSHLRLVVKIAMEFQRRWMQNVLDLIQEGNIGLLRAVNKFDPDKGIKFSYYAKFWIRAYILKFIMDNWRMVKIGTTQAQRKLFYNLNKEKQKLIAQGFDPNIEILSDKLGVSQDEVMEMQQRLASTDLSLDMPVGDESGSTSRLDYLPALTLGIEEGYAESEITDLIHAKLSKFIPKLSEKELFILENRLLTDDPVTLREIGEKYNVTRERIRQLEARLVNKMRNYLTSEINDFSEEWIQQ